MPKDRFAFTWEPWAHLQAFYAGIFLAMGGAMSFFYPNRMLALINLATGIVTVALEFPYPNTKRYGPLSNYYFKALLYAAFVVPGLPQAATHTSVFCLACAAITYFVAAIKGESPRPPKPAPGAKSPAGSSKT